VSTTRRFSTAYTEFNYFRPFGLTLSQSERAGTSVFFRGEVMKRFIRCSLRRSSSFFLTSIFAIGIAGVLMAAPQSAAAATFTVNTTLDLPDINPGDGICNTDVATCSLRAAITESNFTGGANVITVPGGTYTLTLGPADDEFNGAGATMDSGDLDIVDLSTFSLPALTSVTINGAGAGVTIIDGGGIDRVLDINNFAAIGASVDVTLTSLTIRNGNAPVSSGFNESGGGIQFDGFNNQTSVPAGTLTITNSNVTGNTAAGQGGGILAIFGSLIMSGSEVSGNTSVNAAGGGISYDGSSFPGLRTLQITTSRITGNTASNGIFGSGGGVFAGGNATKTIDHSVITTNTAGVQGGGVLNNSGDLLLNFNVIVGNTATANPASSGFRNNAGSVNADNNWWGCNQGPSSAPCDRASGPLGGGIVAWLTLSHTATPSTILVNQSTTLQADFFTNNLNTGIPPADLVALNGRAVVFNNAVLGTISGADPTISAGKANATFTAGPVGGNGSADATVDSATVTASILISEPSSVATNPTDQTVCDGATATFTASANGFPAPTVQWQVSTGGPFADIPGATSTTLMFTATTADDGNQYRAVFTNAGGSATTTAATLTVNTAPVVTTNPANATVCEGGTATFTAAASGSASTVQWQVSSGGGPFTDIPGATNTTLMFTATTADNGNQYRAVFTNSCGTATTTAATLTVNANTTTSDPADATVCQGAIANFSTTAGGTGPFTYAWTVDGSPAGTNSPNLAVDTTGLSVGTHTVAVTTTGACGSASQSATLTVNAPTATTDPPDQTVCKGATATFSTTASGTGPFSYAWTLDGLPYNGNSPTINVPTGSLSSGPHTVTVTTTGACGSAMQTAILTVGDPPVITLSTTTVSVWPPNHNYQTFNVSDFVASASGCDGDLSSSVVIASVSSDEAEDNLFGADGTTLNDIVIAPDCKSVQLRRERDANLNGRVYTITFKVTDSQGNTTTATATVTVPLNQGGPAAVNGPGPGYSVNSLCP
jgi:CSLREA domain-containing protein